MTGCALLAWQRTTVCWWCLWLGRQPKWSHNQVVQFYSWPAVSLQWLPICLWFMKILSVAVHMKKKQQLVRPGNDNKTGSGTFLPACPHHPMVVVHWYKKSNDVPRGSPSHLHYVLLYDIMIQAIVILAMLSSAGELQPECCRQEGGVWFASPGNYKRRAPLTFCWWTI